MLNHRILLVTAAAATITPPTTVRAPEPLTFWGCCPRLHRARPGRGERYAQSDRPAGRIQDLAYARRNGAGISSGPEKAITVPSYVVANLHLRPCFCCVSSKG